jgi:sugar phosphate isomerase/epimerase
MADFGRDYATPMDRGYEVGAENYAGQTGLSIGELAISTMVTKDALQNVVAKMREGASAVELGFMGAGKGNIFGGQISPETIGREQRDAIRELAKLNKVELTTHATVGATGMSGLTEQGFNDEARERNITEIKRAIDFAADTAGGGPIVFHTGEWQRPVYKAGEKYGGKFLAYPEEREKAHIFVADKEKGTIEAIPKDVKLWEPVVDTWETDAKTGEKIPSRYKYNPDGTIAMKEMNYNDIVKMELEKNPNLAPEKAFMNHFYDARLKQSHAEALRWAKASSESEEALEKIKKIIPVWKDIEKHVPEEDRWKFMQEELGDHTIRELANAGLLPKGEKKITSEFLKGIAEKMEKEIYWQREYAISQGKSTETIKKQMNDLRPIEEVGMVKTADSLARTAMYAYDVEQKKGLKKPLFIAPENLFPETGFGAHPQELKEIVQKSREKMADLLVVQKGMSESHAKEVASEHIKATFDIGHATTWRKYFQGSDKEFKDWVVGQVKDLVKSGIIGHVHIADNFGYYDEHLTPGEGIAPIREMVEEIKKAGLKVSYTVEPGAQDPAKQYEALYGTWRLFGSNIYAAVAPGGWSDTWTNVQNSYFGRTQSPNYIVGDIRPSEDWTLWSGVPLE